MWELQFYKTQSCFCPVEEFLDSLPGKTAQKVVWVLKLIEEIDIVPTKYFKKIDGTDNLWEIRIQSGGKSIRLLGFFAKKNLLILNHAFIKKTRKTPMKHIKLAETRKRDHQK
ncbi:MAG: type II toxin-antitoxin system RelE/ParE family toxin [Candidatus Latescibacter sp.]|nr:type II toxin-antitoxin system RelE/ParE family toxin [Candidatus Latescibacter sp.]